MALPMHSMIWNMDALQVHHPLSGRMPQLLMPRLHHHIQHSLLHLRIWLIEVQQVATQKQDGVMQCSSPVVLVLGESHTS